MFYVLTEDSSDTAVLENEKLVMGFRVLIVMSMPLLRSISDSHEVRTR